jgi:hypothetical protein
LLGEERLDCFCLDKRGVLAWFVRAGEVSVSFDSGAGDDTNGLVFSLRAARGRASEDSFNYHDGLLDGLGIECRLTFDMSGGRKQAKLAGGRPLDGRVRAHWTTNLKVMGG